ncbi:MAG: STAS domain-containing protein [Planctomycetes bacterium]|nr:STAS domain-containing protein [Planctomycetota bacterium]
MRPTIKLNAQLQERPTFINVEGEIDTSTARELRHQLLSALAGETKFLLVRLKLVPYMDSSGVAVLLEVIKKAHDRGKRFAVLEPSAAAHKAMAIVDLDALVKVYPTIEDCASCTNFPCEQIRQSVCTDDELAQFAAAGKGA